MQSRKRDERELRALCAHLYPDDGVDPREDKRRNAGVENKSSRKLRQLCKQTARTLQLALGMLPQADALVGVHVRAVRPAPNAGRLCAVLVVPDPGHLEEVAAVVRRYNRVLRGEVASAITRRRAPELIYDVVLEGGEHG